VPETEQGDDTCGLGVKVLQRSPIAARANINHMNNSDLLEPKRKRGRPTRDDAAKYNEYLLEIATKIFLEQGYGATTMDAIANAAGTWKPGVYTRYQTKQALFAAVIRRATQRQLFEEVPEDDSITVVEGLRRHVRSMFYYLIEPRILGIMRLLLREGRAFSELGDLIEEQGATHISEPLKRYLTAQMDKGAFRLVNVNAAQFACWDLVQGRLQRHLFFSDYTAPSNDEIEGWSDEIADIFLNGVGRR
jgi:TetR/AcrR family transcriptional repressor of mexJK operon